MSINHRHFLRRLRKIILIPVMLFLLLTVSAGGVEAADGMSGWDECVVREDEYIEHDFYFLCRQLTIYGTVDGDVMGMAFEVVIAREGHVTGDIWVMGGQLVVQGQIDDDIRFGGATLEITDQASLTGERSDVTAATIDLEIQQDAVIPGDVLMYGVQAVIQGHVGGDIDFQGQILVLDGATIDGNVNLLVGDAREEVSVRTLPLYNIRLRRNYGLYIDRNTSIQGSLNYQSAQKASIPAGVVEGRTTYEQVLEQEDITRAEQPETFISIIRSYIGRVYRDFITFMIVGGLMLWLAPGLMVESGERIRRSLIPAFSWGFILSILTVPMFLLLVIFSLIFFVLVMLLTYFSSLTFAMLVLVILVNLLVIATMAFMVFYLGPAVACFIGGTTIIRAVRRYMARRNADPDDPPIYIPPLASRYRWAALALGVMVFALTVNLPLPSPAPLIELALQACVAWAGLGAVFMYGRDFWYVGGTPIKRRPWLEKATTGKKSVPPPEELDTPLGMDNLPEGFDGFYE